LQGERWFAGSLLVLVVVGAVDVVTPDTSLAASCAVAPFVASTTCSRERTAVVSALTLVLGFVLILTNHQDALSNAVRAAVLLLAAGLAPFVAHVREQREQHIADLTRVARVAQDAVLTPVPPVAGSLRLATAYESASREAQIGGDLFAVVADGRETRLLVGDVRGKGLDAVKTAALALALFREAAHRWDSLGDVAAYCDHHLRPHLGDEDFVTALFASIDESGLTEMVSYGHPAPMLAHHARLTGVDLPDPAGPLGLSLGAGVPGTFRMQLDPGDRLLFFTDGLAEARDSKGEFVDVDALVAGVAAGEFEQALPGVLDRLHHTATSIDDDLALLLVEFGTPVRGNVATADAASA
jgi:serine phosphatase RsbU (regulator of sigma subunit)